MKFIFLGPPGAGKGTLAKQASEALGIPHISTGDLFREAIRNETPLGKKVQAILAKGDLVPDTLTIELVRNRLGDKDCAAGYILDGFPRTIPQAEALETFSRPEAVFNFTLSEEEIVKRLSGRRSCASCGKIYHLLFNPPQRDETCDVCKTPLVTRKDDTLEAIKNRLQVYDTQTFPLIEFYQNRGLLRNIDASPTPEAVFKNFLSLVR